MHKTPIDPELPILDELGQALHEGALASERRLVEQQLTERQPAERQSTEHRRARRGHIAHGGSRMRLVFARLLRRPLLVLPLLVVLGGGAVALAASGVLRSGSAVPATPHLTPDAQLGVPLAGRSRLIAESVPDPVGGPPWSMRVVRTSRDFLCMQIGRLYGAQLGVIGEDGAFDDDRRFHPLPLSAISEVPGRFLSTCEPSNLTSSLEVSGMPASAELPGLAGTLGKPSEERRLYFGLLGPDAVSVTYRQHGRAMTVPVQPGTGAYLIVLPGARPAPRSVADGGKVADGRLVPVSVLSEITYRLGRGVCEERTITTPRGPKACPRGNTFVAPVKPRDLHRAIHVSLRAIRSARSVLVPGGAGRGRTPSPRAARGGSYEAIVAFRAPFAVRSALSDYSVEIPDCRGGAEARALEQNIRAGELVRARVLVFANECRARLTFEVHYHASASVLPSPREETLVGSATVSKPSGVAIIREPPAAGRVRRAR
ncbi:MAG TPA: hypothetical protein VGL37_03430 [Solirubrobacteraceae bacterium]|jgi:hypothetical protein